MAKGKHAAALFEVICSGKKPPKSSLTSGISIPRWWFKGKRKPNPVPSRVLAEVEAAVPFVERAAPVEQPPPMRIAGEGSVSVDKASGEVRFKLSYAGVAAAGFVLVVILTIAYMLGSRTPLVSQSEMFRRASLPVADDAQGQTNTLLAAVDAAPAPSQIPSAPPAAQEAAPSEAPAASGASAAPETVTARQVGLNYVVFQSYPDPAVAQRAMDFLIKAGFPCSVVKLPGSSWSSVVSLKGFEHIHKNPDLDDYKEKIDALSDSFAGRRPFNRFEPTLFKWRPDQQQ